MARTETTRVTYETSLQDGLREANAAGVIMGGGEDEPWVIMLSKVTTVDVVDGRGRNRNESSREYEELALVDANEKTA